MSIAKTPPPAGPILPSHLDLPHTDDKPVENSYQPLQSMLLTASLAPVLNRLHPDGNYYIGADTGIYWRMTQPTERGCRAPDWFFVANVPRLLDGRLRLSYVMWQEAVAPLLVIEYVSGSGEEERDTTPYTGKFWVYERAIKAVYYAIWDPAESQLDAYELTGEEYKPVPRNEHGRIQIPPMEIELGQWEGSFFGNPATWLRAWDSKGDLIPTPEERAEKFAARLRELGVDPEQV